MLLDLSWQGKEEVSGENEVLSGCTESRASTPGVAHERGDRCLFIYENNQSDFSSSVLQLLIGQLGKKHLDNVFELVLLKDIIGHPVHGVKEGRTLRKGGRELLT